MAEAPIEEKNDKVIDTLSAYHPSQDWANSRRYSLLALGFASVFHEDGLRFP